MKKISSNIVGYTFRFIKILTLTITYLAMICPLIAILILIMLISSHYYTNDSIIYEITIAILTGVIASTLIMSFTDYVNNEASIFKIKGLINELGKDAKGGDYDYTDAEIHRIHMILVDINNNIKKHMIILGNKSNIEKDIFKILNALEAQTYINRHLDNNTLVTSAILKETQLGGGRINYLNTILKCMVLAMNNYLPILRDVYLRKKIGKNMNNIDIFIKNVDSVCRGQCDSRIEELNTRHGLLASIYESKHKLHDYIVKIDLDSDINNIINTVHNLIKDMKYCNEDIGNISINDKCKVKDLYAVGVIDTVLLDIELSNIRDDRNIKVKHIKKKILRNIKKLDKDCDKSINYIARHIIDNKIHKIIYNNINID